MDVSSAIIFILIAIIILLLIIFTKLDCDFTLFYYEKFHDYFKKLPKNYFKDQVVWITGGSSGIGEYLAYEFAASEAKLVISGTSIEKLEKVKKNCIERYSLKDDDVLLLPFPIENFAEHEKCVQKVIDTFGQIDILINNAGVSQRADFQTIDIDVDMKLFNINVFGTVNLTRKVLKHMLERRQGHIVVTSSTAGKLGAPYSSSYTGSKHALHGYFECLRIEMNNEKNIHVTLACPGPVFSDLTSRLVTSKLNELYDEKQRPAHKKMSTERCSHLMAIAITRKLDECWICQQPILTLYYFAQYMPFVFRKVIVELAFNKKRIQAMRAGQTQN